MTITRKGMERLLKKHAYSDKILSMPAKIFIKDIASKWSSERDEKTALRFELRHLDNSYIYAQMELQEFQLRLKKDPAWVLIRDLDNKVYLINTAHIIYVEVINLKGLKL